MKKFKSLFMAMLSQDMNFFKFSVKANSSKIKKILFPLFLGMLIMMASGGYAYMFAEGLYKINLTYIMITIFMFSVTIAAIFEGVYKSQGILFDSRDNDLLFSLPIEKSKIFALKIIKLLLFQFVIDLFIIIPTYIVYIYFENPGFNFYIISIIMLLILPIIPTILSVIIGYFIKQLSVKFKAKKLIQTILSLILFIGIFFISYNFQSFMGNIMKKVVSINDLLTKIYYPIGLYVKLIQEFNIVDLIKLIIVNIIPLILVIYIGSINYFKIVSKSSESSGVVSKNNGKNQIKVSSQIKSLTKKELNRFFSSPVYMFNTAFGLFLILIISIVLYINADGLIKMVVNNQGLNLKLDDVYKILPILYIELIVFVGFMTSITSSSISLEGKNFDITRSLPIKEEKILLSKVIMSDIICFPFFIVSDLIFIIKFNISIFYIFMIILFTIIIPNISAMIGLIVNLKYPKMNASNDTEVIKQSMSSTISVFIGLILIGLSILPVIKLFDYANQVILVELCVFIIASLVLWRILIYYGKRKISKIIV